MNRLQELQGKAQAPKHRRSNTSPLLLSPVGFRILRVEKGSLAETAGLKVGDLLTHVDEHQVQSAVDVAQRIGTRQSHIFTVIRDGDFILAQTTKSPILNLRTLAQFSQSRRRKLLKKRALERKKIQEVETTENLIKQENKRQKPLRLGIPRASSAKSFIIEEDALPRKSLPHRSSAKRDTFISKLGLNPSEDDIKRVISTATSEDLEKAKLNFLEAQVRLSFLQWKGSSSHQCGRVLKPLSPCLLKCFPIFAASPCHLVTFF